MNKEMLEKVYSENISSGNKEKSRKIVKLFQKLDKKNNDFVSTRDGIVFAIGLIYVAYQELDDIRTTKSGRDKLKKILSDFELAISTKEDVEENE